MNKRFFFALILLAVSALFASDKLSASELLSLDQAYRTALSKNEQISIQNEHINQAKATYQQGVGALYPHVDFVGTEFYQDTSGIGGGTSGAASTITSGHRPEYKFAFRQSLFGGFRDWDGQAALQSQINKQVILLDQSRRALYQQVASAYLQAVFSDRDLKNVQEIEQLSQSRVDELQRRVGLGRSRNSELLSAEAQRLDLQAQEEAARSQLVAAKLTLSFLLGEDVLGKSIVDAFPDSDIPQSESDVIKNISDRTEIKALGEDLEYQTRAKKIADNAILPSLTLGADYYLKRLDIIDPIKWDATFTLDFPLFQGGTEWGNSQQAESQMRQVQKQLDQQVRSIETALRTDYAFLKSSLLQKKAEERSYQKSKESYALYLQEYRLGLITNLDVLQALNNLLSSRRSMDRSDVQFKLNQIQLKIDRQELP